MKPEPDHLPTSQLEILDYQPPLPKIDMFVRRDPMLPVASFSFGLALGAAISVALGAGFLVYSHEIKIYNLFASVIITFAVIWVESGFSLGIVIVLRRAATFRSLTAVSERASFLTGIIAGPFLLPVGWLYARYLAHSTEDVVFCALLLTEAVTIAGGMTLVRKIPVGQL